MSGARQPAFRLPNRVGSGVAYFGDDRASIDRLFAKGWHVIDIGHYVVVRYARPKVLWEVIVEKAGRLVLAALMLGAAIVAAHEANAQSPALLLETRCEVFDAARRCVLWGPSLVELITRPEIYDGRRVRVVGWMNLAIGDSALYLSQNDWENGLTRSAVWIDPPPNFLIDRGPTGPQPNRRYVIVEGTFKATRRGHLDRYSGALEAVTRLDQWR